MADTRCSAQRAVAAPPGANFGRRLRCSDARISVFAKHLD